MAIRVLALIPTENLLHLRLSRVDLKHFVNYLLILIPFFVGQNEITY